MTNTMTRIDNTVRDLHEKREGHPCEGYWTDRTDDGATMQPRRFVPTCCGVR